MITWHVKSDAEGKAILGKVYSDDERFRIDEDRRVNRDHVVLVDTRYAIYYIVEHAAAAMAIANQIIELEGVDF